MYMPRNAKNCAAVYSTINYKNNQHIKHTLLRLSRWSNLCTAP